MVTTRVIFDGIRFDVDTHKQVFIQVSDPKNVIPFSDLKKLDGYYILTFDRAFTNTAKRTKMKDDPSIIKIQFPETILHENFICENEFASLLNKVSYKNDWGVLLVDKVIEARLNGKLPELKIGPHLYTIDVLNQKLHCTKENLGSISFQSLKLSRDRGFYCCFLNTDLMEVSTGTTNIMFKDPKVSYLKIPTATFRDPIGQALKSGFEPTSILPDFPQIANHVSELRPLGDLSRQELKEALKLLETLKKVKSLKNNIKKI